VRITTLVRKLLAVTQLFVTGVQIGPSGLIARVRPRWRKPRCSQCGRQAPCYDHRPARLWRHLSLGKMRIWLRYGPRRVRCPACGVKVEKVPWAEPGSGFTLAFEELCAYLAQITDQTSVTRLLGIDWRTVGVIVRRVVERRLDPDRLEGVRNIGIDEFSYRKRHRYLTVVVDHDRKRVIWAGPGRSGKTLEGFFVELGPERSQQLENVTMDMSAGYLAVVRERVPEVEIVFDRFHVQRLASDAVDKVRRDLVREAGDAELVKTIKGSRWPLLKKKRNLTDDQQLQLSEIEKQHKPLYRAYLLKESLAEVLENRRASQAREDLEQWLSWASRSRLKPFVKAARTIRKHKEGVLAYIGLRLTNGLLEGLNNKIRVIARRAYGFHSPEALMGMVFLCCGGITLAPPLP